MSRAERSSATPGRSSLPPRRLWSGVAPRRRRGGPGAWAGRLATVARERGAPPRGRGTPEQGATGLLAARVPEAVVHARRRAARQSAPHQGERPSHAQGPLGAGSRLRTPVPATMGQTAPRRPGDPLRWHSALLWQAWYITTDKRCPLVSVPWTLWTDRAAIPPLTDSRSA